jgi:hypothetical protein
LLSVSALLHESNQTTVSPFRCYALRRDIQDSDCKCCVATLLSFSFNGKNGIGFLTRDIRGDKLQKVTKAIIHHFIQQISTCMQMLGGQSKSSDAKRERVTRVSYGERR